MARNGTLTKALLEGIDTIPVSSFSLESANESNSLDEMRQEENIILNSSLNIDIESYLSEQNNENIVEDHFASDIEENNQSILNQELITINTKHQKFLSIYNKTYPTCANDSFYLYPDVNGNFHDCVACRDPRLEAIVNFFNPMPILETLSEWFL